jgi:hypothetical protein
MYRFLINNIITKIGAELPEFKTVALFNDDFNKAEQGLKDLVKFPALYISFPEGVDYSDNGAGVQKTNELKIRFYIAKSITKGRASNNTTVLDLLDLKQKVYKAFQGYKSNGFNTFKRRFEEMDEDRTNYYVFIQDYTTDLIDDTKYIDGGATTHQITALDITQDVVINSGTKTGIRTAKNVNDNG